MIQYSNRLHIVAFDVPLPADYGGVIDIFHKVKTLHEEGVDVVLHCFQYGRKESAKLKKYCSEVHYYKRNGWKNPFLTSLPYIVCTRNSSDLLDNLLKDEAPILFEGIHTTYFLRHPKLKHRTKVVRMHNIEHEYYRNLELVETNLLKKYFFKIESDKLKNYEIYLKHANAIAAISKSDTEYLDEKFGNSVQVSAFHPNDEVKFKKGKGKFAYYHGNLCVGENNHAALYLVNEVFSKLEIPLIIAGNSPSTELEKAIEPHSHIEIRKDLGNQDILNLISEAQLNILPTFQNTGIKLKLINALYLGRHCIVNPDMVEETGLESLCHIGKNAEELRKLVIDLFDKEFDKSEIENRKSVLQKFSNSRSASNLISLIESCERSTVLVTSMASPSV